ncbi:MAG: TerB family tellurite resistance protein [Thalassobaculaceae bacterium]|nr:TerB family tellurite resistance protein [Thalassobaculaceae bacterium]
MSIWGKIIGGAAGFALGGPIGALLGVVGGHAIDRYADDQGVDEESATKKIAFTIGVIALGAKMAKADGVVTRDEISAFRDVFRVPPEEVKNVGRVWDMARQTSDGFEAYAHQIARLFNPGSPVLEQLIGSLFHIAKADGVIHENEVVYLRRVAEIFGFDALAFDRLRATYVGDKGDDPYSMLGVDHSAPDDEVRAAYRRLIREHHPDMLIAQGLPDELISAATERMAAVNAAWDRIKKARGIS